MIYETIVTTLTKDGGVHVAPMGIWEQEGFIVIAPFRPSATLDNLMRERQAVINFTDDVRVFAGCLTGRRDWLVQPARAIRGGVLRQALAHKEVEVVTVQDDTVRPRFYCRVLHEENHAPFRGFNRAQAAVLEAAVLVSRLHLLPADRIDREIEYLRSAVEKTAGPQEQEAWDWLMERIAQYRREQGCAA